MPTRLSKIDELARPDHTFLASDDDCYYLGEYTARKGFAFSEMNNLINNLRKPMERRGRPEWRYKEEAITECGRMFREALNPDWLSYTTLVPIPSSKMRGAADYDDRLPRILAELSRGRQLDIREMVVMRRSIQQSHLTDERVSIEDLIGSMGIDEATVQSSPRAVAIFDDVLTTGRHFKAVQRLLRERFPTVPIVGMFVVRRVPESMLPGASV